MRQQLDRIHWGHIVPFGRTLALAVIALGVVVAIWNWTDREANPFFSHEPERNLLRDILLFVWYGALILIVTEMVGAVGRDDVSVGSIDVQVPRITSLLAGIIIVSGTALAVWDIKALRETYEGSRGLLGFSFLPPPSALTTSESIRYFLEQELQTYLWQGGLLFLLAALAGRVGWRNALDLPEEEEGSLVATEP